MTHPNTHHGPHPPRLHHHHHQHHKMHKSSNKAFPPFPLKLVGTICGINSMQSALPCWAAPWVLSPLVSTHFQITFHLLSMFIQSIIIVHLTHVKIRHHLHFYLIGKEHVVICCMHYSYQILVSQTYLSKKFKFQRLILFYKMTSK